MRFALVHLAALLALCAYAERASAQPAPPPAAPAPAAPAPAPDRVPDPAQPAPPTTPSDPAPAAPAAPSDPAPATPANQADPSRPVATSAEGERVEAAAGGPPNPEAAREGEAAEARDASGANDPTTAPPQDYDKRAEAPRPKAGDARRWQEPPNTETEDYFLLVPRIVLFPPNLVLKLVAMPLRGAAILIDRYYLVEHTKDLLYNDARTAGILPVAGYQSGYGFTYGAKVFHDDLFGNDEEINLAARYGGLFVQGYGMSFVGDQIAHTPLWVEANASYEKKPALFFDGIGNELESVATPGVSPREASVPTRFQEKRVMGRLTLGASVGELGDRSHVGVTGLFNHRTFGPEQREFPEPSIEEIYDTAQIQGFDEGVDVLELTPTFIYDSRDLEAAPSKGVYLDLFGGHTAPVTDDANFWHYGGYVATFVNLYRKTRVLSFRAVVEAVHGDEQDVPFTELMKLGGPDSLRGYQLDRFRDKVSALGSIEYRYPVHELVSGEVFIDAGRVGRSYAEIFDRDGIEEFHYGGGLGFVFHSDDDIWFKAQAAYGEELLFFLSTDPLRAFRRRYKRL